MVHGHREYTYSWGALFGFNVNLDVEADSTDCRIMNVHLDKTKIAVTQSGPFWEVLGESEVVIEREEADRQGCTSTYGHKDKWDKWVAHGHVTVGYSPGIPYWNPFGGGFGTFSKRVVTVKVELAIVIFPDNSTQLPPEVVTTTPF